MLYINWLCINPLYHNVQQHENDEEMLKGDQDPLLPNYQLVSTSTFNPAPTTFTSQSTADTIELQPLSNQRPQQPPPALMLPKPPANDHLFLTLALMCACAVLGFNMLGMACLLPALICSALVMHTALEMLIAISIGRVVY